MKSLKLFTVLIPAATLLLMAYTLETNAHCTTDCQEFCVTNAGPCEVDITLNTSCGTIHITNVQPDSSVCLQPPALDCCIESATITPAVGSSCPSLFSVTCRAGNSCPMRPPFTGVRVSECYVYVF